MDCQTCKERRTTLLWRSLLAFTLLGCARYGIWYLHSQHVAYAASWGVSEADLWRQTTEEAKCHARHLPFYDYFSESLYPLTRYFAEQPRARASLVQFVSGTELVLLGLNLWLFLVHDVWILLQMFTAFAVVLVLGSASWTPLLCNAVRLHSGEAWLSDALTGGLRTLPLGGFSGSTVFVSLGLYNVYTRRPIADMAFLSVGTLAFYSLYHMTLRWNSLLDEVFSVCFAIALVLALQRVRALYNVSRLIRTAPTWTIQSPTSRAKSATPRLTSDVPVFPSSPQITLQATLAAYSMAQTLGDTTLDAAMPSLNLDDDIQFGRPSLHEIEIYQPH